MLKKYGYSGMYSVLPSPLTFADSSPLDASDFTFLSALFSFFFDSTAIIEKHKAEVKIP